jgi:DMSO reductase anchor subunit
MHPAYSVILFTTASGAGYGLLIWLALAWLGTTWLPGRTLMLAMTLIALVLVTAGLLSSTFHLGHPERAWRAMSQWKSSWLSREGVAALLTYPPAVVFCAGFLFDSLPSPVVTAAAWLTLVGALLTVCCTAMIYASLTTIPRWNNAWVLPVYLLMALASGGLIFVLAGSLQQNLAFSALAAVLSALVLAWFAKSSYWRQINREKPESDTGTATGLGFLGEVRQLEAPHTSDNYLLKEMGYQVGRKHAQRLRRLSMNLGLVAPGILLIAGFFTPAPWQPLLLSLAMLLGLAAIVIERWLFFAEARHKVTLFYGRSL